MYPGMMGWWKHARRHGAPCGGEAGQSHSGAHDARWAHGPEWRGRPEAGAYAGPEHDVDFGAFGVRRPLRFLSYKLDLEEAQVTELARVLNELKTERAQAAVDHRRTTAALADAIAGDALDEAKLAGATAERVKSAERLRDAVAGAIRKIHAVLTPEQRAKFAYLIRTGAISLSIFRRPRRAASDAPRRRTRRRVGRRLVAGRAGLEKPRVSATTTRLRPPRFASYIAVSARRSSASGDSSPSHDASPIETVCATAVPSA